MINPLDAIAALQKAHNLASGLYRAGAGMPKYRLYLELFKAAPADPPYTAHQEEFLNFLVQAKILLKETDYQQIIADNIEPIYRAKYATASISEAAGKIEINAFPFLLAEADRRYQEFGEAYEKISSKGFSTAAETISKQIIKNKEQTNKPITLNKIQDVNSVSLELFRKNFVEFIAPEHTKNTKKIEKQDDDKEINIEEAAKTNGLDVNPIPVSINHQTVTLLPRKIQRRNNLKGIIEARVDAAAKHANSAQQNNCLTDEHIDNITAGLYSYLHKKEIHHENNFIINSLNKIPPFSMPANINPIFRKLSPQSSANLLAIITIIAETDNAYPKIEKGMTISRIASIGQINRWFKNPPNKPQPSDFETMASTESIERTIREKLGESNEANQLIATLNEFKNTHPKMKIGALFDCYMQEIMFPAVITGKKPIESILEICEADATAKEYVAYMGEVIQKSLEYMTNEANLKPASLKAITLKELIKRIASNHIDNINFSEERDFSVSDKDRSDTNSDNSDDDVDYEKLETPLKEFSQLLQARILSKKETSKITKTVRTVTFKKDKASKKQERTEDALSEAILMIEENLEYVLKQGKDRHKTRESEALHAANITIVDTKKQILSEKKQRHESLQTSSQKEINELILAKKSIIDSFSKQNKQLNANAKTDITLFDNEILEINSSIVQIEKEIDALQDSIYDLENVIDSYNDNELLENPEVIVRQICLKMNEARQKDENGVINESAAETETQIRYFQEFCNALCETRPEGPALAAFVRDDVLKEINQGVNEENKIVVKMVEKQPRQRLPITPSALFGNVSMMFDPAKTISLPKKQYDHYLLDKALVQERATLISDVTSVLNQKRMDNDTYKSKHNGADNPKIAQLQNALSYLKNTDAFYRENEFSVERKYSDAALSESSIAGKSNNFALTHKFQKALSGNMGTDDTVVLLNKVKEHHESVEKAHEQSIKHSASSSLRK